MKPTLPILKTKRLTLKDYNEDQINDLFEIFGDAETMKYYDMFAYSKPEEVKELIDLFYKRLEKGEGIRWGVFLENKLIGTCGFNKYRAYGRADIGYDLNRKYWGKGYMSEAVKKVIHYGFNELKIHRIEAFITPGNIASEKVALKNNFTKEGLLNHVTYYKGAYQSQYLYAKINYEQEYKK